MVDFVPNFDENEKEPVVLPARVPNLLVNGSDGIAVGMATNIPPHNLGEVIDAAKAYLKNPDITTEKLLKLMPGPDFPTGGIVVNKDELPAIYESGTGKIKIRGRVEVEKLKGGKEQLVITEIPYTMIGANIGKFLNDVASLVETRKAPEITDISNQSSKEGIRIVLELKKGTDTEALKNLLYKKTRLEDTFGVNMLAVADGRPETLGLKQILEYYIEFQYELTTRKYRTLLAKEQGEERDSGRPDQSLRRHRSDYRDLKGQPECKGSKGLSDPKAPRRESVSNQKPPESGLPNCGLRRARRTRFWRCACTGSLVWRFRLS